MLEEVLDLSAGFGVALLPMLVLSVPGIILFVVLPAILLVALAAPLAAIGAMIAVPPFLLSRWRRRRRSLDDIANAGGRGLPTAASPAIAGTSTPRRG